MTQSPPDIDPDGFPLIPLLTVGREVPITARSLPRLVASLVTGALIARTEEVTAMVVFVDRQPVDGLALREGRRVTGPDALDEIADVPIERLSFVELPRDLAGVLGTYFLPTAVREVPAALVVPDAFVRSLARPDCRGCVLVRTGSGTGMVFLAAGKVVLSVGPNLLTDPDARLWARLGPIPEHLFPTARLSHAPAAAADEVVERILERARERLHRHSTAVEEVFRAAPTTEAGLRSAAESVRALRIRLVSPATMSEVADDAIAVLSGRKVAP